MVLDEDDELRKRLAGLAYQSPIQAYSGAILVMTDPNDELYQLELQLRGLALNSSGQLIKMGDPLLNDKGILSVISQMKSIVHQITIMSNLDKKEYPNLLKFWGGSLINDLMINRSVYGVDNPSSRTKIYIMCMSMAYVTAKRAFEAGDKKFWKGSQQEITTRFEGVGPKGGEVKEGWIQKLTGWGK